MAFRTVQPSSPGSGTSWAMSNASTVAGSGVALGFSHPGDVQCLSTRLQFRNRHGGPGPVRLALFTEPLPQVRKPARLAVACPCPEVLKPLRYMPTNSLLTVTSRSWERRVWPAPPEQPRQPLPALHRTVAPLLRLLPAPGLRWASLCLDPESRRELSSHPAAVLHGCCQRRPQAHSAPLVCLSITRVGRDINRLNQWGIRNSIWSRGRRSRRRHRGAYVFAHG